MIKLSKTKGGSYTEPMRIWHIRKLWGKFEFKEKVGNSKLIQTELTQGGVTPCPPEILPLL